MNTLGSTSTLPQDDAILERLFPNEEFGFRMKFQKGSIPEFYENNSSHADLIAARTKCLSESQDRHVALEDRAAPLLKEAIDAAFSGHVSEAERLLPPGQLCRLLAERAEPDFLLLAPSVNYEEFHLCGGSVCFPSSWSFEEKMGKKLEVIHEPVPGLNDAIAPRINSFLRAMKPGISWNRTNWGLSRSPELNQHPDRVLPRLESSTPCGEIFLRVEWQSLVALPSGVLFGIRVFVYPIARIIQQQSLRLGFEKALRTMPDNVAQYKNLLSARDEILAMVARSQHG
jgi:hypothetical protein